MPQWRHFGNGTRYVKENMNVKTRNHEKKSNVMCQYTGPFSLFTRVQQAIFFLISTCGLLQIVGIEKWIFFSYMIHEDTLKS